MVWINSLFFLSICRIFDNIFHTSRGIYTISPIMLRLRIRLGMAARRDTTVTPNNAHHLHAHIGTMIVITDANTNNPTSNIYLGTSACCMVLSM